MIIWFKKHIKLILAILIISLVGFFFFKEFKKNWGEILEMKLMLNIPLLVLSFIVIVLAYLGNTLSWRYLINAYHPNLSSISVKESIAIVNTTQLAKYIPGKVWSYAVQIYWLSKRGYSKSNVFFINLVATVSTLLAATAVGMVMISITLKDIGVQGALLIIAAVIIGYAIFIFFHTFIFNLLIKLAGKVVKRDIEKVSISFKIILLTQFFYLINNIIFCLGGFLLCYSIGIPFDFTLYVCLIGSLLIGDVIGFVVLVMPGGLGVRESMMYFIIKGIASIDIALVVPIATRLLTMSVDISLGIAAFFIGQKNVFKKDTYFKTKHRV